VGDAGQQDAQPTDAAPTRDSGFSTPTWCRQLGGPSWDQGRDVVVDSSGNSYVIGEFVGTVDFGGTRLTSLDEWADVFLASYAPDGTLRWAQRLGEPGEDLGMELAVDGAGNLYYAAQPETAAQTRDVRFASVAADSGVERWRRYIPWDSRFNVSQSYLGQVVAGNSGQVYLVGGYVDAIDLGGGAYETTGLGVDAFIGAYTAQGVPTVGGSADAVHGLAEDATGVVYLTGECGGPIDLGGGDLPYADSRDMFLAAFSSAGAHLWSRGYGAAGADTGIEIAVGASGNLYVAAICNSVPGPCDFGGGPITARGERDVVIVSYTSTGEHRWSRHFGNAYDDLLTALDLDDEENVYVSVRFRDTVELGGTTVTSAGWNDGLVASYSSAGDFRWAERFGGADDDMPRGLVVDPDGAVYVVGYFEGTAELPCGSLTSSGEDDAFLLKLVRP
jgi:hypothetical protein